MPSRISYDSGRFWIAPLRLVPSVGTNLRSTKSSKFVYGPCGTRRIEAGGSRSIASQTLSKPSRSLKTEPRRHNMIDRADGDEARLERRSQLRIIATLRARIQIGGR